MTIEYIANFDDVEMKARKFTGFENCEPGNPGNVQRAKQFGLRRTSMNRCPLLLVGKKRRNYQYIHEENCWCNSNLNDHSATWITENGKKFVIWEPYGIWGEELAKIIDLSESEGLGVRIGTSFWYPSRTVGIWFFKDVSHA